MVNESLPYTVTGCSPLVCRELLVEILLRPAKTASEDLVAIRSSGLSLVSFPWAKNLQFGQVGLPLFSKGRGRIFFSSGLPCDPISYALPLGATFEIGAGARLSQHSISVTD